MTETEILLVALTRLSRLVMWLIFVTFHVALLALMLAIAWWYRIGPTQVQTSVQTFFLQSTVAKTLGMLGALGLSLSLVLALYAKIWRKAFSKFGGDFLFPRTR